MKAGMYGSLLIGGLASMYLAIKSTLYSVEAGQKAIKFSRLTGLGKKTFR